MKDIVQRLRETHQVARAAGGDMMIYGPGLPVCAEAADEIEELREALRLTASTLRRAISDIQSELPQATEGGGS